MPRKNRKTGINVKGSDPNRTEYQRKYYRKYRAKTSKRRKR